MHDDRLVLRIPWKKTPPMKRRREIIVPVSASLHMTVDPFAPETRATLVASIARGRRWLDDDCCSGTRHRYRANRCAGEMQHSTSQYDDLARFPRAQSRACRRRRTIAAGDWRRASARCSGGVVPPVCDVRSANLMHTSRSADRHSGAPDRHRFSEDIRSRTAGSRKSVAVYRTRVSVPRNGILSGRDRRPETAP